MATGIPRIASELGWEEGSQFFLMDYKNSRPCAGVKNSVLKAKTGSHEKYNFLICCKVAGEVKMMFSQDSQFLL